jgi:pimeloyl-ACP methyl ester carboxylesterase
MLGKDAAVGTGRKVLIAFGVAFVALIAFLVINRITVDDDTLAASTGDSGTTLRLPGGDLHVERAGPRDARPVVLIHGWASSVDWWYRLTPVLARRYRVIRFDLLGHGGSEKPKDGYSMTHQADQIAAGMRKLGITRALVGGHSTGGEVAIALAARHPELVRRLVVLDTETDEDQVDVDLATKATVTPFIGELSWRLITEGQIRDGLKQAFSSDSYPVPQEFIDDFQDMTYTAYKKTYDESADYVDDGTERADFRRSRAPAMIVFGMQDRLVDPRAAREYAKIRPAKVAYVAGAGHAVFVEKPAAVARLIERFDR